MADELSGIEEIRVGEKGFGNVGKRDVGRFWGDFE